MNKDGAPAAPAVVRLENLSKRYSPDRPPVLDGINLELRPGYTLEEGDVQRHLAGRLARYKIPKRFFVVDELPRTASGKIRKAEVRRAAGRSATP